jgi:hypothetical protein
MRSFALFGLGLVLSVAACAVVGGDDGESSASDISFGRPGHGRPPGQPVLAEEDAAPPAPPQPSILGSADDGGSPPPPPAADEDAGDAGPPADDAGEAPPVIDPGPPEDAGP